MKKAICMIALAAISFGTVVAAPMHTMQQDTAMKMKKKPMKKKMMKKKSSKMMKDTSKMKM